MQDIYTDGTYLDRNPTWHEQDSPWKAAQVMKLLERHHLPIRTVAEIGCGVGGILVSLHEQFPPDVELHGFDIAREAIDRAKTRERERLHFHHADPLQEEATFDLLLIMDVIEHVPDYLGFMEQCRKQARFKLYHIPLGIHVSSVLRPSSFAHTRREVGHIHNFTAEMALASLTDTGHKILESSFTPGALELPTRNVVRKLARVPRRLMSLVSIPWAARLMGGYSLLALTE